MKDYASVLDRYRRQPLPMRLGNLASNLARIRTMALDQRTVADGAKVVEESRHFADTLIADTNPFLSEEMANLRDLLDEWLAAWPRLAQPSESLTEITKAAARWSALLIERSGLAQRDSPTSER